MKVSSFLFILSFILCFQHLSGQSTPAPLFQTLITQAPHYTVPIGGGSTRVRHIEIGNQCGLWMTNSGRTSSASLGEWLTRFENGQIVYSVDIPLSYPISGMVTQMDMEADNNGNVYDVGMLDAGSQYIEKISPNGALLWDAYTTLGVSSASAIEIKNNGVYVAGWFRDYVYFNATDSLTNPSGTQDANFLVKLDTLGNLQWKRQFPYSYQSSSLLTGEITEIIADNAGIIYTIGTFMGTFSIDGHTVNSAGGKDIFIAKFDSQGLCTQLVRAGSIADDFAADMELKPNGNLAVAATNGASATLGSLFLPNASLFSATYDASTLLPLSAYSLLPISNSGQAQIDENNITYVLAADSSIFKYDATGNIIWHKVNYWANADFEPICIAINANSSFALGGAMDNLNYFYIDYLFEPATTTYPNLAYYKKSYTAIYFDTTLTCGGTTLSAFINYNDYGCADIQLSANISSGSTGSYTYSWYIDNGTLPNSHLDSLFSTSATPICGDGELITLVVSNGTSFYTTSTVFVERDVLPPPMPYLTASALSTCNTVTLYTDSTLGYYDNMGTYVAYDISWYSNLMGYFVLPPFVGSFEAVPDTYTVALFDPITGCSTTSLPIVISAGFSILINTTNANYGNANGSACAIVSGGTAPYTYSWSNGQTTNCINNLSAGNYSVDITDATGCQINKTIIITNTTAIQNALEMGNWELYPNPNKGDFILKSFTNADLEANIGIFDVTGRSIYAQKAILNAQSEIPFHLDVSEGVYFLKMETKEGVFFQKFVIE